MHVHPSHLRSIRRGKVVALTALLAIAISTGMTGCSKKRGTGTGDASDPLSEESLALQNQERYGDGSGIPNAQGSGAYGEYFRDVLFSYDSSVVGDEYHEQLRKDAEQLVNEPTLKAEVEGHCDKRGTAEYNYALGNRRAKAVAATLVQFGASPKQITTISYGEEVPLVQGDSEDAFAQNRRAHFAVTRQ